MIKINFEYQKNNYIKNNIIVKYFSENNKFIKTIVLNENEIIKYFSKDIKLSENILNSEMYLKDLILYKLENKGFIYL